MQNSNSSIFASSHPKCGTNLLQAILSAITGYRDFFDCFEDYKQTLHDMVIEQYGTKPVDHENMIEIGARVFFKENGLDVTLRLERENKQYEFFTIFLDFDFVKNILGADPFFYAHHAAPADFINSKFGSLVKHKIFIIRDFRDVVNSYNKFVTQSEAHYNLMNVLNDYDSFQKIQYFNLDRFHYLAGTWKQYVTQYLGMKDNMLFIRYEDLVSSPEKEIKKLADYIGQDIDDAKIADIISKYMNVNLADVESYHKFFRHYSGSEKRTGEWSLFFNDYLTEKAKELVGDLLVALGYENDSSWTQEKHSLPQLSDFKVRLDNACRHYDLEFSRTNAVMYIKNINSIIADNKVVFYGAGSYMQRLLKVLDHKENIMFCVDDNAQKLGSRTGELPVYDNKALIEKFMDYDLVMLTVNHEYSFNLRHNLNQFEFPSFKVLDIFNHDIDILTLSDTNILMLKQELYGNG
ncbi:MAG: sulfotransferase domain-containing protein [Deferribacterales bacterium]